MKMLLLFQIGSMERGSPLVEPMIAEQRQVYGEQKQKQKIINYTKYRIIKV